MDTTVCPKDGTPLSEIRAWAEGSVVRGKYRIIQRVGVGGMATVYKAEHVHFGEVCALKVVNADLIHNEALIERFMREAVLTRRLHHPNAVRVDDIDRAEDGSPFMVMEFLEGQTLYELLHYEGPLPFARICTIAGQVASAIHAAHEIGIIHRDIKPANITILQTPNGEVAKVLDFGIAKFKEAHINYALENDFTLTTAGMIVGTPAYISPEQAQGKRGSELDGRSDVYSFAVMVYQMLTNRLPVQADSEEQFVMAHATQPADNITRYIPDLPLPVAQCLMQCLSKYPNDRPSDPQVLTNEMAKWIQSVDPEPSKTTPQPKIAPPPPRWVVLSLIAAIAVFAIAAISFLLHEIATPRVSDTGQTTIQQPYLSLPSGDMILIPGGPAVLGDHDDVVRVRSFYIDKTEVSTRAYLDFCRKTHHSVPPGISLSDGDLPIRNISFADASDFATWARKRLPTSLEWEKAARGTQGQHFPWGNDLGTGMANLPAVPDESSANIQPQGAPAGVNSFPQGDSSYGARNMVGNVWEWVSGPSPQIRGGSFQSYPPALNRSFESLLYSGEAVSAQTKRPDVGFRCAR